MKMPEKHDLLAAILAAKEQGIGAILAFAMAYLRGRYNGGAFTKTVIDVTNGAIVIHTQRLKSDPGGNLLS
ncbi:holin (gpS protein) [Escherichia coli TA271]|nr:holin (gpS protein) [Escherichia coli TA271]